MSIRLQLLGADDIGVLDHVAEGVFDQPINPRWARQFLDDPRHHMVVALDGSTVVGMISAVDYVHPDKAPQLWINEVGVAPSHHRRGIGKQLVSSMLEHGRRLGCSEAWLGTEETNVPARALYSSVGSTSESFELYSFELGEPATPA